MRLIFQDWVDGGDMGLGKSGLSVRLFHGVELGAGRVLGSGKQSARRLERKMCLHLEEGNTFQVFPLLLCPSEYRPLNLTSSDSFHYRQHPETRTFLRTIWTQLAACFYQLHRPGTDSGTEEQEVRFPCPW